MNNCTYTVSGEKYDRDCFCKDMNALRLQSSIVQKQIDAEKVSGSILSFYDQLRLQEQIQNTPYLAQDIKKNLLYTNGRLINDIAYKIDEGGVDYPKSYQNYTKDKVTNTVINAISNRRTHLQTNPFGTKQ